MSKIIPVTACATFACNPEQVALLRLLSSFEWDVKPMLLVLYLVPMPVASKTPDPSEKHE
jgi:hypothetical protein